MTLGQIGSYWAFSARSLDTKMTPLSSDEVCDVAIVGAGYTGLSAAIELANAGVDVRVIEAEEPSWGASGRNGGFACVGSHKLPYPTMIARYGLDATRAYYATMKDAIELVRELCDPRDVSGGGEVSLAHLPNRMGDLRAEQAYMKQTFGEAFELLDPQELRAQGLASDGFYGGLHGKAGFGVHPLNYARTLAAKVGARIHPHSPLIHVERDRLITPHGSLRAKRILFATNGYTPERVIAPLAGRLLPVLSNIVVTRPLTEAERKAQGWTSPVMAYDSRNLLHYFRLLPDGRFLFGGRGGTSEKVSLRERLTRTFHTLFPAWAHAEITHFWRGYACLSNDRVPFVGPLDDAKTQWTAIAYHGNGVAMATWSGRAVARLMMDKTKPGEIPAVLTRRLAKFPLPALRPLYLKGAYLWYGYKDAR